MKSDENFVIRIKGFLFERLTRSNISVPFLFSRSIAFGMPRTISTRPSWKPTSSPISTLPASSLPSQTN